MFKKLFVLCVLSLLLMSKSFAQLDPECNNIIGQAVNQPSGSMVCTPFALNPAIPTAGTPVTRCFSYQFTGPVNLGYLLVTGQCGPFPLYNTLSYTIYNATCDTLITSGNIFPFNINNDTFIDELIPNEWYIICYHWVANCPQTDACPIIYTSLLPIELISFEVEPQENKNVIQWSTASEINNDYFVLERASEVNVWEIINITEGAGNSNNILNYKFIDENPKSGTNYYRLKQVDYNGNYEYSNIISAKSIFIEKYIIMPNPAKNVLNIYSTSEKHSQVNIEIFNENGIRVYSNEGAKLNSSDKLEIDIENFGSGVYFVNILTLNNPMQFVSKFIKN